MRKWGLLFLFITIRLLLQGLGLRLGLGPELGLLVQRADGHDGVAHGRLEAAELHH